MPEVRWLSKTMTSSAWIYNNRFYRTDIDEIPKFLKLLHQNPIFFQFIYQLDLYKLIELSYHGHWVHERVTAFRERFFRFSRIEQHVLSWNRLFLKNMYEKYVWNFSSCSSYVHLIIASGALSVVLIYWYGIGI